MIRSATVADLEALLDLWHLLMENGQRADPRFRTAPGALPRMSEWMRNAWFESEPFSRVLVWEQQGIHGFIHGFPRSALDVVAIPPTARIGDLFVRASHRRAGIGGALVRAFKTLAQDAGFSRFEVGTLALDHQAVQFWSSHDFRPWQVTLSSED